MEEFDEVLRFWLEETGPQGWYEASAALDATIKAKYEGLWHRAMSGDLASWGLSPRGALAFLIVVDQFPRNMFRGDARSFASDGLARATAKRAIERGFDLRICEPERQFFYLPLTHSECLCDQDRAVRLIASRMTAGSTTLLHARAHRNVIRQFGRFPFRNAALNRTSTATEASFMAAGGYGSVVRSLETEAA